MGVAIFSGLCILFDIITGIIKAIYNGDLNSTALRKGMLHKLSEIVTLAGAWLVQQFIVAGVVSFTLDVFVPIALYISLMEIVSVLENICCVNPSLAKVLKPYLTKLKDTENNADERKNEK